MATQQQYRPDVDGLRALAIISVLLFHAFPTVLPGGFIGVDIFFVISGFLITGILRNALNEKSFSLISFYDRRLRRIGPALCLILSLVFFVGWLVLIPEEFTKLGQHVFASALFAANFQFWHEAGYFDTAAPTKPLLHLWSLGVEEQFYLIWPICLWVGYRLRARLDVLAGIMWLASFVYNVAIVHRQPIADFYWPMARLWELLAGALICLGSLEVGSEKRVLRDLGSIMGMICLGVGICTINVASAFPGWWALLPVIGTSSIIAAGHRAFLNRWVVGSKPLVWVGLISYPLYLWHWPLLSYGSILAHGTPTVGYRIGALLAAVVLAWVTFLVVEKPLRRSRFKLIALVLLATILGLGAAGYYVKHIHQLSFMYKADPETMKLASGGEWVVAGCGVSPDEKPLVRDCFTDRRETPTYALWGDSHATALLPGLMRESTPGARWEDIGAGGCPPMVGIRRVIPGEPGYDTPTICADTDGVAVHVLESSPNIRAVVFVTASRMVTAPYYAKNKGDQPYADAIVDGMGAAAERLHVAGKEVYLLVDNPTLPDPRECIERLVTVPAERPKPCTISLEQNQVATAAYRQILQRIKDKWPFVIIVDPTSRICFDGFCSVAHGNQFLYSYGDHYSDVGNGIVGRYLIDQIAEHEK